MSLPLKLQAYDPNTPHSHNNGLNGLVTTKTHSTSKRTLHIFDSIQSIFQSSNHHSHSFNHRHNHNHDKKHKHNHSVEKSTHQSNAKHKNPLKFGDSDKTNADSVSNDRQRNEHYVMHSNDLDGDTGDGAPSKIQNVTRILINSTNPQRQPNGKYENILVPRRKIARM